MYLEVHVRAHGEALLLVALDGRLVAVVRTRQVVVGLARTAVHRHTALERRAGIVKHVKPVGVGRRILVQLVVLIGERALVEARIGVGLLGQLHKLLGIEHLRRRRAVDVGNAVLHVDVDVRLALAALPRGHQYDAIAAVGTVDGGRRGILQHSYRLNVVGVQERQRTDGIVLAGHQVGGTAREHRHAVDHPKRLAAGRERPFATHPDVEAGARIVGRVAVDVNLHAGNQAVEHRVEPTLRHVL